MTTQADSLDLSAMSWLKTARILLNFGWHQIQPVWTHSSNYSSRFCRPPILMSHSVVCGAAPISFHQDASFRMNVKTSVDAAHRLQPQWALLCWHASLFTLPVAQVCRKGCKDFAACGTMYLLNWTKWKSGALGVLLITAKSFCKDLSMSSQLISKWKHSNKS